MNTTYSTYKKAHNNYILDTQTCIQHTAQWNVGQILYDTIIIFLVFNVGRGSVTILMI